MTTPAPIPKIGMILRELGSRKFRESSTGGAIIRSWSSSATNSASSNKGFFETIFDGALRFGNFLISGAISLISFSFTKLWSWIVSGVQFIYNFDGNISDTAIDKQIEGLWQSFGGILGGSVGRAIGWIGCGLVPAATVFSFNQSLGTYLLKQVGEQALDEMLDAASAVINAAFRLGTQAAFLWLYKDIRRALKDPNNPFGNALRGVLGSKTIDNWGQGESWTMAKAVEKKIESIPDKFWKNFAEEAFEEGSEACIEAGFAVAGGIDAYLAQQAMTNNAVLGSDRTVEITPDRSVPDERIVLSGPEAVLRPAVVQVMATHQMLGNRDVGVLINGNSVDDYVRPQFQQRYLIVEFREKEQPPWLLPTGKRARKKQITIPDVERGLTWEKIKLAAKKFTAGDTLVNAPLNNGRQMQVYAATENEGMQKIEELLKLSTAKLLPRAARGSSYVNPSAARRVLPYIVYPSKAVLVWRKRSADSEGRMDLADNRWDEQRIEFDLWPEEEPVGIEPLG
ncbi:MAG: hypothetical protein JGK17_31050 [Microcoleus sp. PH2017_10_PVI_O_A]|uniref:hypothetical protein n=1 Tax=unclassified Microcoleus TaxID=2642155 RepID=UPI001D6EB6E6|nr:MULTISPECIES: hypothetical protein [unclassified Microcoleus]MCC3409898.1 hypothetical protein [Microcoleus sp. PH2017_10_PVI_O_A]MCC3464072.1 hypothetical protein [Microcoleus sp. PH2017_11_PCY_U_A]MCC3482425.1 hypothetical protein [Microcoleus sp. PH2017_12_PCY_D_A]MCC3531015.1 hypothetical protein [Microcoleus sp. PH2017_21_RUC_O_A]MCC3539741.1 hypothetical protein [Microcoleus sp. PH2017_22_RUC_O_B]